MLIKRGLSCLIIIALLVGTLSACGGNTEQMTSAPDDTVTNEVSVDIPAVGDTITFGSYEQDNDLSNGSEDIEWSVLAVDGNRVLVISKYVLDVQRYHESVSRVTWETSTIRGWLNNDFLNAAFNEEEQSMIPTVLVQNEDNPNHGTPGGNDTEDRVFLLSIHEASTYFHADNEARACGATAYAIGQGLFFEEDTHYNPLGGVNWWLRSPGEDPFAVATVTQNGRYEYHYYSATDITISGGVRPAIWIDYGA